MKNNQFFSLNRFILLLRNDLIINYKSYLFSLAGAFIIGFIILYMNMPKYEYLKHFDSLDYVGMFIISLFAIGGFVGSSFPELSSKTNTSNYLMLPGSTFEKYMVQFFIRIILGLTCFLTIFWIDAQLARIIATNTLETINKKDIIEPFTYSIFFDKTHQFAPGKTLYDYIATVLALFSIGLYLFSVRLYFKKFALIKSIISLGVVAYIFFLLMALFTQLFYPRLGNFEIYFNSYEVIANKKNILIFSYLIVYLTWLFILPLGYFKLKEKQV